MPHAMTVKGFRTVTQRDFGNGAVQDEIYYALKEREELLAALEGINPSAVKEVLEACEELMAADHPDHFACRLSDSEMEALDKMKAAVKKARS